MRIRALLFVVPIAVAVVVAGIAMAGSGQDELATVRNATATYHDIAAARAAGYITELPQTAAFGGGTCIANGSEGAMGIHMLDNRPGGRLDGNLDPANPRRSLSIGNDLERELEQDGIQEPFRQRAARRPGRLEQNGVVGAHLAVDGDPLE